MASVPPLPLPTSLDAIDRAWMNAALRTRAPEATVHAFEIVEVIHGTCTKVRIALDLNEAGERAGIAGSVILKGGFEPHSRDMASMHEREVRGYNEILPVLDLPSPRCFFAQYDPEGQQGIVIMEDLAATGARFCNPLQPPSREEIERRLTVLARFHAKSFDSAEFADGGRWSWLGETNALTLEYSGHYLEEQTWGRFVTSPRGAAVSVRFHDREWMANAVVKFSEVAAQSPQCVLHSDTHIGNTYIAADGTPAFFDAQPTRGPQMLEIAYNLSCAIDSGRRREWEVPLIRHYLVELASHGVPAPTLDEALRQYAIYLARAYFIFVVNESHYQDEAINTAYTARINTAMIEHDTFDVVNSL